jgi:UDP-N-acetylglucosamine:LPS N-acetylglucosamine transferase
MNAIFVPNEASEMDDQLLRARVAEAAGLGQAVPLRDLPRLGNAIRQGLEPGRQAALEARSAALRYEDGAAQMASLLVEVLLSVRTDLPLARALPRPFL